MGTCFSKKKTSSYSSSSSFSCPPSVAADCGNVAVSSATVMADPNNCQHSNNLKFKSENTETKTKLKPEKTTATLQQGNQEQAEEEATMVKKEIFVIKHRKSHEGSRDRDSKNPPPHQNAVPIDGFVASASTVEVASVELMDNKVPAVAAMGVGVRTSSCTKEEVDAILIQCGRLSRSSSGKAASSSASYDRGRKYSGSKRSYDFDHCDNNVAAIAAEEEKSENNEFDGDGMGAEKRHSHRQRTRQSSRSSPSSQSRRRTPSRERDQQRSSSRERRVSRSPGRRSSETGNTPSGATSAAGAATAVNGGNSGTVANRPGKMVSVPASISSLVMDKSNNNGESATATVKRISVKRNVGGDQAAMAGSRTAASPRAQSPSRANSVIAKSSNEQQQQQPSLSRNSSRKAEQSPYRRNPLNEIDPNSLQYPQPHNNNNVNRSQNKFKRETAEEEIHVKEPSIVLMNQTPNVEMNKTMNVVAPQVSNSYRTSSRGTTDNNKVVNLPVQAGTTTVTDSLKPQSLTRSRSSRRSRDLDLNPEILLNPTTPSYTRLLLEDIQNFHQKSTNTNTTVVSLPPCVSKACSILEAVADLNSATSSNLSCAFSDDRTSPPPPADQPNKINGYNYSLGANFLGKNISEKDPFVESEVIGNDDLTEPSFHKYVTVRRGGAADMEDQESSGSNSYVGGGGGQQLNWNLSSSSWEPNSADSTDCWTSRSSSREEFGKSPVSLNMVEVEAEEEAWKRLSGRRSGGIGRGRLGASIKGLHANPVVAATAST